MCHVPLARPPHKMHAPQVCWEKHWGSDASAIMLNIYKCTLASCVFIAAVGVYAAVIGGPFLSAAMPGAFSPLLLSSIIGIVVGDVMWLKALQVRYTAVAIQLWSWLYGCGYTAMVIRLWLVVRCGASLHCGSLFVTSILTHHALDTTHRHATHRHATHRHAISSLHSQLLGTRRLVVIDMVKPFLAAFAGALILEKKEPVTPLMWAGMVRMTSPLLHPDFILTSH